jgi:hypothetical protein
VGYFINNFNSLSFIQMKSDKDYKKRVNVCWEVGEERACRTMSKDEAYALKRWLDDNNGFTFWFQALDD